MACAVLATGSRGGAWACVVGNVGVGALAVGKAGAMRTPSGIDEWVKRKRGTDGTMVGGWTVGCTIEGGRFATESGEGGGVVGCRQASSVACVGPMSAPSEFGTALARCRRGDGSGTGMGSPVNRFSDREA